MKRWKWLTIGAVCVALTALITAKEFGISREAARSPAGPEALQTRIEAFYAERLPSVIVFHIEPSQYCCDGTRIMYEEMRSDAETLVSLLEGVCPSLFIDVNALASEDRPALMSLLERYSLKDFNSAIVVDADGEFLASFGPMYMVSQVVDYARKVTG